MTMEDNVITLRVIVRVPQKVRFSHLTSITQFTQALAVKSRKGGILQVATLGSRTTAELGSSRSQEIQTAKRPGSEAIPAHHCLSSPVNSSNNL